MGKNCVPKICISKSLIFHRFSGHTKKVWLLNEERALNGEAIYKLKQEIWLAINEKNTECYN